MSIRVRGPDIARYENSAVLPPAQSVTELRNQLAQSRHTWQKQCVTEQAVQLQASQEEISRRTMEIKKRVMERMLPNAKAIETAARLQAQLASVGAAAAAQHNLNTSFAATKTFDERVEAATRSGADPEECAPIEFGASAAEQQHATATAAAAAGEHTGALALVGYAEAEKAQLLESGRQATTELSRIATQATEEV